MEFAQTSAILEFYVWFRFWPYHRSRHVILHQSAKFYPNRTTLGRENDVVSIVKMADLSHLGFYWSNNGFIKSPCTTSNRSSIETIALNYLVFEKIAFSHFGVKIQDGGSPIKMADHSSKLLIFWENRVFVFWRQTDKQTDRQTNRWTGPLHEAALDVASGGLVVSLTRSSAVAMRPRDTPCVEKFAVIQSYSRSFECIYTVE